MADATLSQVAKLLGTAVPHLYLEVTQGEHCQLRFPDGRRLSVGCTPDDYSITDQQGRILISVARNLNRADGAAAAWDDVHVEWPTDDRFKAENAPDPFLPDDGTEPEPADAHYARLNTRFDQRAVVLRNLGFAYQLIPGMNIAVFTRTRFGRVHTVAAGTVINADDVVWADTLARAERFAA